MSQQTKRLGPRPLALHLTASVMTSLGSTTALPFLRGGSLPWKAELREQAAALMEQVRLAERHQDKGSLSDPFAAAVDVVARQQCDLVLSGLESYRHHPYHRALADPPVIWAEGSSRLLDYGQGDAGALPVLFVPSLVNRHYILDLAEGRSLVRWMAAQRLGDRPLRPLLLDWGMPGPWERRFTLTDYIAGRLERAVEAVTSQRDGRSRDQGKVAVVGYCMGGLLATALAWRRPDLVGRLGLMATPWDFHAENADMARRTAAMIEPYGPMIDAWGELPVDVIQSLFARLDPLLAVRKFARFARMRQDSPAATLFVALEDWLNDGVPLVAGVARDAMAGWYGRNDTARGAWLVGGAPVRPDILRLPTLALIPQQDRIVPPASAQALAEKIPRTQIIMPPLGHIGMVVSAGAIKGAWQPLAEWLSGAS